MPEQRNLILAIVLSVTIIIAFQYFYELPRIKDAQQQEAIRTEQAVDEGRGATPARSRRSRPARPARRARPGPRQTARSEIIESADRVDLDNGRIRGSLSLTGGRIDNLILSDYQADHRAGLARRRPAQPAGLARALFRRVRLGLGRPGGARCPAATRSGSADRTELRPGQPVTLTWDNGEGLRFERAHRDRRRLHVHDHPAGRERRRRGGLALSLWPGQPLGHARDARLLHPARGPDRRAERQAGGDRLRRPAGGRQRSSCRAAAAGSASPTSTGWRRWCRIRRASSRANLSRQCGRRPGPLPGRLPAHRR